VEAGARVVTVTVLVTDLVESTTVLDREGENAAGALRAQHEALVRTIVDVFDGTTVKSTGDGYLTTFDSADAAVRCAAALLEASSGDSIRLGLSTGDATVGSDDIFGQPAIEAARLAALAAPGEALVGERTVAVRGRRVMPPLEPRGACHLKGFDEPIEIAAVRPSRPVDPRRLRTLTPAHAMVGRDVELQHLLAAWQRAADGPAFALITGEPGIGKTHLAAALAHRLDAEAFVAHVGFEEGRADGFEHLSTRLDELAANVPIGALAARGRAIAGWLATLCPSVAERLPLAIEPPSDAQRDEASTALLELFAQLAARAPVLLVLDDVHWSGAAVQTLVDRLRRDGPAGILVVATARRSLAPDPLVQLASADGSLIALHGLAPHEVTELLRHATPHVSPQRAEAIQQRTGGNPFLVLAIVDQAAEAADADPVATQFLRLPPGRADALSAAAVLGRTFDAYLLRQVVDVPLPDVLDHLDAACVAGLLAEGDQPGRFAFTHDLVREAAAARLGLTARARLHGRAADALTGNDTSPSELVEHVVASWSLRPPEDGVALVERAVQRAIDHLAFEEALALASRADEVVESDPRAGVAERARTLLLLSVACQLVGDIPQHKATAGQAGWAAREARRPDLLARAALARAGYGIAGVPDPESEALLRAALDATAPHESGQRAELLGMLAFYRFNYVGDGDGARTLSRESLDVARRSGDVACVAQALSMRTYVFLAGSAVDEQLAVLGELSELTPRLDPQQRRQMAATATRHAAVARLQLGDRSGFEAHRANLRRMADRRRSWLLRGLGVAWDAMAALLDGELVIAEEAATSLLGSPYQDSNFRNSAALILAEVHRNRGSSELVAPEIAKFAESMPYLATARAVDAFMAGITGDAERASRALDTGGDRLQDDSTLAGQLALLTEAHVLSGRSIPEWIVEALLPFRGQLLVMAWGVIVHGAADRFLGIAAALAGRTDVATRLFDTAADLESRVGIALPLRTQLWRSVLLGDVALPGVPPELARGVARERTALEQAVARPRPAASSTV
jgi:class 3 adenylate cyclase